MDELRMPSLWWKGISHTCGAAAAAATALVAAAAVVAVVLLVLVRVWGQARVRRRSVARLAAGVGWLAAGAGWATPPPCRACAGRPRAVRMDAHLYARTPIPCITRMPLWSCWWRRCHGRSRRRGCLPSMPQPAPSLPPLAQGERTGNAMAAHWPHTSNHGIAMAA